MSAAFDTLDPRLLCQKFEIYGCDTKTCEWFTSFLTGRKQREIQARIAQLVAYRLGTVEVPGSNTGKGKNFLVKISYWIVRISIRLSNFKYEHLKESDNGLSLNQ